MSSFTRIRWFGDKVLKLIQSDMSKRVEKAGDSIRDHIKSKLNVPVVYEAFQPNTEGGATSNIGKVVQRSAPGEYPRRQWGTLRRSIVHEHSRRKAESRIGTNLKYGKFLEIGTRRMRRRPWLSRGFREALPKAKAIIKGGV